MNVLGIIAEYNPFHNGHLYHLQKARQEAQADYVICVMSGNFVQRGEPALLDKWARAKMAISQGVDLVFELPVLYATRSAYWFAKGGILSLAQTGLVTHVAFGVETPDPALLQEIALLLAQEPPAFRDLLRQGLKEGLSFPQARAKALFPKDLQQQELLENPNNVLALSYLQVLQEEQLPLIPIMLERQGNAYLDDTLKEGVLPSATALRQALTTTDLAERTDKPAMTDAFLNKLNSLAAYLPPATVQILENEYLAGKTPVSLKALDTTLLTILRRTTKKDLEQIVDVSEGLENRIAKIAAQCHNLTDFLAGLKTKRYTYTRLQRFLIHLLLNYTKSENDFLKYGPPYLHLLGYTPKGRELLKQLKKKAKLPLIIKGSQINKYLLTDPILQRFWEYDVRATNLYTLLYPQNSTRCGNLDYLKQPVFYTKDSDETC
jgi:predicted nucleotidyltransferase